MKQSKLQNNFLKIGFIVLSIFLIIPSIIYLIKNGTILGFNNYYNFFIDDGNNKHISTMIYLTTLVLMATIYIFLIKKKDMFKNVKELIIFTGIVSGIFVIMLPWTSSDIFYYMGVGELNSVYGQNPYYVTVKDYCNEHMNEVKDDNIMEQGYNNYWSGTTVIYGPIAQTIFSIITKISFKNINLCLILFKIVNLIMHLINCYLIYKITKKIKFAKIYALNPYILLEFIGVAHNDIIVVFLVLLALYYLTKKQKLFPCIFLLSLATGIKYFTVLLLPIVILYHYRNEKSIMGRIIRCFEYGAIFLVLFVFEYAFFYKDITIFTAMMVQNDKFSKSIYSGIIGLGDLNQMNTIEIFGEQFVVREISKIIKNIVLSFFVLSYIKFCIDLLTTKNIKLYKSLRKYNFELILFMLSLATFQQWYLIWIFATLVWQKSKMIKGVMLLTIASEVANSVYMFNVESYKFDIFFWGIMILPVIFLQKGIVTKLKRRKKKKKTIIN